MLLIVKSSFVESKPKGYEETTNLKELQESRPCIEYVADSIIIIYIKKRINNYSWLFSSKIKKSYFYIPHPIKYNLYSSQVLLESTHRFIH